MCGVVYHYTLFCLDIYICMYVNGKNFVDNLPALNLFSFSLSN